MSCTYDMVITGGRVPDFSTGALKCTSLGIADGKIAAVVPADDTAATEELLREAGEVVDADGHVVSPGFIDIHMHEENISETDDYLIGRYMVRMGVTSCLCGNCGESPQTFEEFSAWVRSKGGAPTNYLVLAGYNDYRHTQGPGTYDAATPEQQRATQELVRRELEAGCVGVSFGLEYDPGITTQEMTDAVRAVTDLDPFVSIHFREDCTGAIASLEEMAQLSRDTKVPVEVSHLSSLAGYGYMDEALDFIRKEMAENPLFGYDTYPYNAFCTTLGSAVFDVDWRAKWGCDYDAILFQYPPYRGQRATREAYEEMREKEPEQTVVCFAMKPAEIGAAVVEPLGFICSDGGVYDGECHPRAAGTFPRVFSQYVRGTKSLSLMDALEKMTIKAARRIGIDAHKGSIEVGKDADLVIFDPETIEDRSTFEEATLSPVGIDRVIVDGTTVVLNGKDTGALPGRVLTRADVKRSY